MMMKSRVDFTIGVLFNQRNNLGKYDIIKSSNLNDVNVFIR